ncbi:MAG: DUF4129 domain-containing protein [Anaerolineales bacterium]
MDNPIKIDQRLIIIIALTITVSAFIILSSGLSKIHLERGKFLIPENLATQTPSITDIPETNVFKSPLNKIDVYKILSRVIFWVLLPLSFLFTLLSPGNRKRRLIILSITTFSLLLFIYLWSSIIQQANLDQFQQEIQLTLVPTMPSGTVFPRPDRIDTSPILYYSIVLFVFLSLLLGSWMIWRRIRSREVSLKVFANTAQKALDELQAGIEIRNVVIRAYYQMSQVLDQELGITRKDAMTPREFEVKLEGAGLPAEEVQQLTRVFEAVRYGTTQVNWELEHQAITSLTAIIEACRKI